MPPQKHGDKRNIIIAIVAACVVVGAIIGVLAFNAGTNPDSPSLAPSSSSTASESDNGSQTDVGDQPQSAESAPAAETPDESAEPEIDAATVEQYRQVIESYNTALAGGSYDATRVNPEAVGAAQHGANFQYAFYDFDGDGKKDLLISTDQPGMEEGLEVDYTLYDMYGVGQSDPYRVIDSEHMQSLGYRAYCVICEDDVVAVGGSGGANYNVRQYSGPEQGMAMGYRDKVTIDGDTYTFDGSDGQQTLSGDAGRAQYEQVIAKYKPVTDIVWHPLNEYPSPNAGGSADSEDASNNAAARAETAESFCRAFFEHRGGVPGPNVDSLADKRKNQVAECLQYVEPGSPLESRILNEMVTVDGRFAGSLIIEVRDVNCESVSGNKATVTVTYAAAYASAGSLPDSTRDFTATVVFADDNLITDVTSDGEMSPTY